MVSHDWSWSICVYVLGHNSTIPCKAASALHQSFAASSPFWTLSTPCWTCSFSATLCETSCNGNAGRCHNKSHSSKVVRPWCIIVSMVCHQNQWCTTRIRGIQKQFRRSMDSPDDAKDQPVISTFTAGLLYLLIAPLDCPQLLHCHGKLLLQLYCSCFGASLIILIHGREAKLSKWQKAIHTLCERQPSMCFSILEPSDSISATRWTVGATFSWKENDDQRDIAKWVSTIALAPSLENADSERQHLRSHTPNLSGGLKVGWEDIPPEDWKWIIYVQRNTYHTHTCAHKISASIRVCP